MPDLLPGKLFITLICSLLIPVLFSCAKDDDKEEVLSLEELLPKHLTSNNFNYYMLEDDYVDTVFQEHYINWLTAEFKVKLTPKIEYYKFRDREHKYEITSVDGNAHALEGKVFTICPRDNHECVHVITLWFYGFPRYFLMKD